MAPALDAGPPAFIKNTFVNRHLVETMEIPHQVRELEFLK